jgi:hypothetical protein
MPQGAPYYLPCGGNVKRNPTFMEILSRVAVANALALEKKACNASILAKLFPRYSSVLYGIKHAAVHQLFRVDGLEPQLRPEEGTVYQSSILLMRTRRLLHVPLAVIAASRRRAA